MPTINPDLPSNGDDATVDVYNAAIQAVLAVINGAIDEDNLADGGVLLAKLSSAVQASLIPVGTVLAYGGSAAPTGFLLCFGQSVLRSSYADLFSIVGTSFGSADGTHFNLPDLRGRIPVGLDNMGGTAANRIQKSTTITTTNASPTATVASVAGLAVGMFVESANVPDGTTITVMSGTTLTLSANATATAGGTAARFGFYGDAQEMGDAGGTDAHALIIAQLAAHTHTTASTTTTAGGSGAAIFVPSGSTQTGGTGGDQPHINVQPGQVMNYMIKT